MPRLGDIWINRNQEDFYFKCEDVKRASTLFFDKSMFLSSFISSKDNSTHTKYSTEISIL